MNLWWVIIPFACVLIIAITWRLPKSVRNRSDISEKSDATNGNGSDEKTDTSKQKKASEKKETEHSYLNTGEGKIHHESSWFSKLLQLAVTLVLVVLIVGFARIVWVWGSAPYDFSDHGRVVKISADAVLPPVVLPRSSHLLVPAIGNGYSDILDVPDGTKLCKNITVGDILGVEVRDEGSSDQNHWRDISPVNPVLHRGNAERLYGKTSEAVTEGYGYVYENDPCPPGDYPTD